MTNLYTVLQESFPGGGPFILSPKGETLHTYPNLDKDTAPQAHLLHRLSLAPGDRLLVQTQKSPATLLLYLSALRAGAIYLPLNPAYTDDELHHFIKDAEPRLIICDPKRQAFFTQAAPSAQTLTLDAAGQGTFTAQLGKEADFPTTPRRPDDPAVILYTSGTTGKPKGAMLSHRNLAQNAQTLHKAWQWRAGDTMLHALPLFHVHGLFVGVHPAMLNASPIILLPAFNPAEVIKLLPQASVFMGVPTHYTRLLATGSLNPEACSAMRLFTCGSAPLLPQTFAAFKQATGHEIVERYGMTETGMNTSNPIEGQRKPGTVGPALPGVETRIVGEDLQPVPPGETGMLLVRGPNVFKGYWRLPDKTAEDFTKDGFFKTGDLASMDADGYLSLVGRSKDLIITGGLNVYPKEVEAAIDRLPGIAESAVIGLPHPDFGEAVTAIVVLQPAASPAPADASPPTPESAFPDTEEAPEPTPESIIAQLRSQLASFKLPKQVFFADQLPRNTMGKVQKNLLRNPLITTTPPAEGECAKCKAFGGWGGNRR